MAAKKRPQAARQGVSGMPRVVNLALLAALLSGAAVAGNLSGARAAVHDGNWSVLIITERGDCDRGYRYPVNVANGHVRYTGQAGLNLSGTVAPNGAVKVSIRMGDAGADGTGRLSPTGGSGTWRGAGSGGTCAGRWEAERR
jgi:hypothetical protein